MKIKSSVNKNVSVAVQNCREVLVTETIGLLKQIGVEPGQDVFFGRTLFLFQTKDNMSETILVNSISYADGRNGMLYYMVAFGSGERFCKSDIMLSVSNLQTVYEEVRRVVREY